MDYQTRLTYGLNREQLFRQYLNNRPGWSCYEQGQNILERDEKLALQNTFISFDSQEGQKLLDCLPVEWRNLYVNRLIEKGTPGIPCADRFDPDACCSFNGKLAFRAEIKSDVGDIYPNITYCFSGYLWANNTSKDEKGKKIFIFDLGDDVSEWRYLFLDQLYTYTHQVHSGKGLKGSQTPHGRVSKQRLKNLNQPLKNLIGYIETMLSK